MNVYISNLRSLNSTTIYSDNGGQSWSTSEAILSETLKAPEVAVLSDGSEIYALTGGCGNYSLLKSPDQGETFEDISFNSVQVDVTQLEDLGEGQFIAKSCNIDMLSTTDDGQTWAKYRTPEGQGIVRLKTINNGNLLAATHDNRLIRSTDNGSNWQDITPEEPSGPLLIIDFASLEDGQLMLISESTVFYSIDGGQGWTVTLPPVTRADQVFGFQNSKFICYSEEHTLPSTILVFDPADESWIDSSPEAYVFSISYGFVTPQGKIVFYGLHNDLEFSGLSVPALAISDNQGQSFIATELPWMFSNGGLSSRPLCANSLGELFILISNDVHKSIDGGQNWLRYHEEVPGHYGGIQFLTTDQQNRLYYRDQFGTIARTTNPTAHASFITGDLWSDFNLDCLEQEENENDLSSWLVQASTDTNSYYGYTNATGKYLLNAPAGSYQVQAITDNPLYENCSDPIAISLSENDTLERLDFPVHPIDYCALIRPTISTPFLRRCFENVYSVSICNEGTITAENVVATIALDDFLLFQSSNYQVSQQTGQNYTFELGAIAASQCVNFTINVIVDCAAQIGQEHCIEITTTPPNSCVLTLAPPSYLECQNNIGAYDPNDKRAFVDGYELTDYLLPGTERLSYHIRFQNTGTDTAFTVVVEDILPPELDISGFRLESNSHPVELSFPSEPESGATIIRFTFDDIQLVDSFTNEPASHGFVKFSLALNQELEPGADIDNFADIFFDFNEPIRTNTASLVYDFSNSATEPTDEQWRVKLYPNPFTASLKLRLPNAPVGPVQCDWFNAQGQLVDHQTIMNGEASWAAPHLPAGLYMYCLRINGQVLANGKVIKQ